MSLAPLLLDDDTFCTGDADVRLWLKLNKATENLHIVDRMVDDVIIPLFQRIRLLAPERLSDDTIISYRRTATDGIEINAYYAAKEIFAEQNSFHSIICFICTLVKKMYKTTRIFHENVPEFNAILLQISALKNPDTFMDFVYAHASMQMSFQASTGLNTKIMREESQVPYMANPLELVRLMRRAGAIAPFKKATERTMSKLPILTPYCLTLLGHITHSPTNPALAMALHKRLGAGSRLGLLDQELIRKIANEACAEEEAAPVLELFEYLYGL